MKSNRGRRDMISDEFVEKVEDLIGMSHGGWDMVDPKEIIEAVLEVAGDGGEDAG